MFVHALIKYRNELMSFVSKTVRFFSCFYKDMSFFFFFDVFSFGANKENLLHVTHDYIISLLHVD